MERGDDPHSETEAQVPAHVALQVAAIRLPMSTIVGRAPGPHPNFLRDP
jgi:hypothetical protein